MSCAAAEFGSAVVIAVTAAVTPVCWNRWRPVAAVAVILVTVTADKLTLRVAATPVMNALCAAGVKVATVRPLMNTDR